MNRLTSNKKTSEMGMYELSHNCMFIKDGEVFHQIYKANMSDEEMYAKISAALTVLATGGEQGE